MEVDGAFGPAKLGSGAGADFFAAADISIIAMLIIPCIIVGTIGKLFLWMGLTTIGDMLYYGPAIVIVALIMMAIIALVRGK